MGEFLRSDDRGDRVGLEGPSERICVGKNVVPFFLAISHTSPHKDEFVDVFVVV